MNQAIKVWHLLSAIVGVVLALSTLVYYVGVKVGTIEIKVQTLEVRQVTEQTRQDLFNQRVESKLDKSNEQLSTIMVMLQDKQDRKK